MIGDWLTPITITARGSRPLATRRTRDGDFQPATTGDLNLATCGYFYMATDTCSTITPFGVPVEPEV
jgi:hypothetical protein